MVNEPDALLWLGVTPKISAGAGTVLILAIIYAFSNLIAITCKWRSTVRSKLTHSTSKHGSSSRRSGQLKRSHLERCCCGRLVTAMWRWYFYIRGKRSPYFYVRHEKGGGGGGGKTTRTNQLPSPPPSPPFLSSLYQLICQRTICGPRKYGRLSGKGSLSR